MLVIDAVLVLNISVDTLRLRGKNRLNIIQGARKNNCT